MILSKIDFVHKFMKDWEANIDPVLVKLLTENFLYYEYRIVSDSTLAITFMPIDPTKCNAISVTIMKNSNGEFIPDDKTILEFIQSDLE